MRGLCLNVLILFSLMVFVSCSDDNADNNSSDMGLNSNGGNITITNARIWTGDPQDPYKTSMTVMDGMIVAMDAETSIGRVVDAEGRLIVPGFWDGHTHPQTPYVLTSPGAPTLFEAESIQQVQDILREYIEEHPEDTYPRLFGWGDGVFEGNSQPTRDLLDKIVPDKPCYLVHSSGHKHWTNTKALEVAGILESDPPDLAAGTIVRDQQGLATGYLIETELASTHGILLRSVKKQQPLTFEYQVKLQQKILEEYAQWGVTGVWTKDGDLDITDIYQQILLEDNLPVRVILDHLYTPYSKDGDIEMFAQRANEIAGNPVYDGFLRADGIKIILDLPYHLWMHESYDNNGTPTTGHPLEDMNEVRRQIFEADINGLSINVLTMGDRAVTEALDVLEEVTAQNPPRTRRHTVEHAEWIKESDLSRFDELGVVVVMNYMASYPSDFIPYLEQVFGKERLNNRYQRLKDIVDAGAIVVQGSDFPLAHRDPMLGMHVMVNGTDLEGNPQGGLWPHKNISIEEALKTFSVNVAYSANESKRFGKLKEGYAADFVILSQDILDSSFDPLQLIKVKTNLTVFNGHVVYEDFSDTEKVVDYGL